MSLSAPGRRVVPDTARGVGASARTSYKRSSDDAAGGARTADDGDEDGDDARGSATARPTSVATASARASATSAARAAREDDAARRRSAGGRRAGPIGVSRSTATFNARRAGTRASGSRRSVVRASTSFEDAIEVAVAAVSGGATREAARRVPRRAPRSGRAPPTRDAEKDLRVQASRLPRRWASTPLLGRARSHVLCLGFPRSNGGFDRSESKPCARIRPIVPESSRSAPPRSLDQSRVASTSRAEEPQPLSSSRAADGAWCASAGGISPRAAPLATRAGTAQVRLSPARSRAGRPPSRARAFASPTALSPRPPLPFAAIDPRVVTRPDRRRLARCPPAPRSPPAPGRSARPPRRA